MEDSYPRNCFPNLCKLPNGGDPRAGDGVVGPPGRTENWEGWVIMLQTDCIAGVIFTVSEEAVSGKKAGRIRYFLQNCDNAVFLTNSL